MKKSILLWFCVLQRAPNPKLVVIVEVKTVILTISTIYKLWILSFHRLHDQNRNSRGSRETLRHQQSLGRLPCDAFGMSVSKMRLIKLRPSRSVHYDRYVTTFPDSSSSPSNMASPTTSGVGGRIDLHPLLPNRSPCLLRRRHPMSVLTRDFKCIDDDSIDDSDGSIVTTMTTTTTCTNQYSNSASNIDNMVNISSSASSSPPTSLTHHRRTLTPQQQLRKIQFRRQYQHNTHPSTTGFIASPMRNRIRYVTRHTRSCEEPETSSSLLQRRQQHILSGLQLSSQQSSSGVPSESIEMKLMSPTSSPSALSSFTPSYFERCRLVISHDDSIATTTTTTNATSFDMDTIETATTSFGASERDSEDVKESRCNSIYKRSPSYHGKGH